MNNPEFPDKPNFPIPKEIAEYYSAILEEFLDREYGETPSIKGVSNNQTASERQESVRDFWEKQAGAMVFEVNQTLHVGYDDNVKFDPNLNVFIYRAGFMIREEHYAQNGEYFYTIDVTTDQSGNPIELVLLHSSGYGCKSAITRETETNPYNGKQRNICFINHEIVRARKRNLPDECILLEFVPGSSVFFQQHNFSAPESPSHSKTDFDDGDF